MRLFHLRSDSFYATSR